MNFWLVGCAALILTFHNVAGDNFDYMTFTQEWPPTFCSQKSCRFPPGSVNGWNIHGLWPSSSSGKSPEHCKTGGEFNINNLTPILDQLKRAWANLEDYNTPSEFWRYEWNTHGRCATTDKLTGTELEYFNASVVLKNAIGLDKRLAAANIVPRDSPYDTAEIYQALERLYNVQSVVRCTSIDGQAHLIEIRFCFDTSLKIIDCPVDFSNSLFKEFLLSRLSNGLGTNPCPDSVFYLPFSSLKKTMTLTVV